jgi:YD repeat-containing protein
MLLTITSIVANGQHLFTQGISTKDRLADMKRSELKISLYKWIKSDSTYFYVESYSKNGQIISHYDSESTVTKYDYNNFGKRIRAFELINNKPETAWEAQYINDTILFKVRNYNAPEYIEELFFDSLEREIKHYKIYRKSKRIDSIITNYSDRSRIEITYENGKPILKIVGKSNVSISTEDYYNFITPDSTVHYLTWSSKFDLKGNVTSRVQKFYDRDEKTEYITTYTDNNLEKTSTVKTNGKIKFETTNYYDKNNRLIKSIYKEQDYMTETVYFYNDINLESKSITTTLKKGQKPETEIFYSIYEFYADK